MPVPADLEYKLIASARWGIYKNFLDGRGKDYNQVLLTDTRDVIFQGDVFEKYADLKSFFGYVTEGEFIKNNRTNYKWLFELFGKDVAEKFKNEEIICSGTVLGTVDEIKIFCDKMSSILVNNTVFGADQGAENYLVREKLLDFENIIEINCEHGNIFTAGYFLKKNPVKIEGEKILSGNGGIPAVVHQYDRQKVFVQLADKIFRDKNFQPNEKFSDTRSMFDQCFYLANIGKIDDAYKLFTKHLFGKNFDGSADKLIKLWNVILTKKFTQASELLILSIQGALISTDGKNLNLGIINQMASVTDFCIKNRIGISFSFKNFLGSILFSMANQSYAAKQLEQCVTCMNFLNELDIPKNKDFYLFQAKIYRESGKKAEALAAYEKALG